VCILLVKKCVIKQSNLLMPFKEWGDIYSDNQRETIKILCHQNASFFNVRSSGLYSYHWTLKGLKTMKRSLLLIYWNPSKRLENISQGT
jgi:hypothetical protein